MKLIHSTGATLEVRDVGPVLVKLHAGSVPLKFNGWRITSDDDARNVLRDLIATGLYIREK